MFVILVRVRQLTMTSRRELSAPFPLGSELALTLMIYLTSHGEQLHIVFQLLRTETTPQEDLNPCPLDVILT